MAHEPDTRGVHALRDRGVLVAISPWTAQELLDAKILELLA